MGLEFLGAACAIVLFVSMAILLRGRNTQWSYLLSMMNMQVSYRRDNRNRDKLYGKPDPEMHVDTSELADKAPTFRYIS
jgi:hypothetical protein